METCRDEILSIDGLSKSFGKLQVLKDVTFSVGAGELIAILGPSGCGKTTLLRVVAGLVPFEAGRVLLNGQGATKRNSRDLGMVFQEPRLLPWRTTYENVHLPFELFGCADEASSAVEASLALVGLSDFASSYPHELSGGMRSRVALARALAPDPGLLIMDEPLTGLDLRNREELQDEIIRIWSEKNISLLLVTHDPSEAIHMADRIIVLSGRPSRIRDIISVSIPRPRPRDVAEVWALEQTIRNLFSDD